jgi:hypothetical protein
MTTTVRKGSGRAHTNAKREKAAQRNPVVAVKPDPLAWAAALKLAGGDAARLHTAPDGGVIVSNQPRKRDPNASK